MAGEKIYYARCSTCHGDELGGVERAPALAGPQFLEAWHGRSLRRLLDRIDDMPPSEPKSLSPADAVAVLAFLLRASEMPSGSTALPTDRTQLGEITFERAAP
jgi:mono/diheme cytochrome c family protein